MERVRLDHEGDKMDVILFKGMPVIHPKGFGGNIWCLPVGNSLIIRNEDNDYKVDKTAIKLSDEYLTKSRLLKNLLKITESKIFREHAIVRDKFFVDLRKASKLEVGHKIENAEWEGKPCKATVCDVILDDENGFEDYWAKPFIGMKRKAIMVEQGEDNFFLDNEDGSGCVKLLFPNENIPYAHLKASIIHCIKK